MNGGGSGSGLGIAGLTLRLGGFALRGIDLAVMADEILAIIGPNGAGKSVTLETIAGFHRPSAGRLMLAGRDLTGLPPEQRQIGLLPQNYGLFPHLSVAANIALPMRTAGAAAADPGPRRTLAALLGRFGLAHLAGRLPGALSPGERQRTALARALAARPRLFLFDEPFAALDAPTREALRGELRGFLRAERVPAVFVTHDLAEAMELADRLAVMRDGQILQQGRAEEVYRRPADIAVAGLLGVENILCGEAIGGGPTGPCFRVGDVVLGASASRRGGAGERRRVALAIRAEDVALRAAPCGPAAADAGSNRLAARVRAVANAGALVKVMLDCGGFPLTARLTSREAQPLALAAGMILTAEIARDAVQVL